ncbi:MAG: hypothetical protein JWP03_151 [Phycisphaerales bacterium]|jgi:hypothetical protein|nr:hypothetical protein [Phycisphaerales bacterium]
MERAIPAGRRRTLPHARTTRGRHVAKGIQLSDRDRRLFFWQGRLTATFATASRYRIDSRTCPKRPEYSSIVFLRTGLYKDGLLQGSGACADRGCGKQRLPDRSVFSPEPAEAVGGGEAGRSPLLPFAILAWHGMVVALAANSRHDRTRCPRGGQDRGGVACGGFLR